MAHVSDGDLDGARDSAVLFVAHPVGHVVLGNGTCARNDNSISNRLLDFIRCVAFSSSSCRTLPS